MSDLQCFCWHPEARLFVGAREIPRPVANQSKGFVWISADAADEALSDLGQAISNGQGFCVIGGESPPVLSVGKRMFITLTGGSSGNPKGILRSQQSWIASFETNAQRFEFGERDSVAVFGALSHSLALYGVIEGLHQGLDTHVLAGLSAAKQHALIDACDVTILYLTPTQLRLLCNDQDMQLPSVRLVLCGGGALDGPLRRRTQALCPNAKVVEFYGAAETSFITLSDAAAPEGSLGLPYPGVTISVRDNNFRPTEDVGEVWVKSPYLFENYAFGDSPDTRWREGFLTVGELGQLDADGQLWLKGRKSRVETIADQTVYLEEIERFLREQTKATNCAVLALPDQMRGRRLVAVFEGDVNRQLERSVKEACHARFGPMIAPRKVVFHPAFPMLASGKPDLIGLAQWLEGQE